MKEHDIPSFTLESEPERIKRLERPARRANVTSQRESSAKSIYDVYDEYDSSLGSIQDTFREIIPGYDEARVERDMEYLRTTRENPPPYGYLKAYVETELESVRGRAVGVELGGTGSRLFQGFSDGFFQKTFGLSLTDVRDEKQRQVDSEHGHAVITGDMFQGDSLQTLEEILGKKSVHLFIERMSGYGTPGIPLEPVFIGNFLKRLYSMLSEKGIILAEMPFNNLVVISTYAWLTKLKLRHQGKFALGISMIGFRMQRLPSAPDELPLLSAREQLRVQKLYESTNSLDKSIDKIEEVLD